jgi:protein-S-isoprenylcysteine O-methyltransferase Ste14
MKKLQLLLKSVSVAFLFFIILLISAGRLDYWQGWLYISMNIIMNLMTFFAARSNPDLINERLKPGEGTKNWDKIILGISSLVYIAMLVVAGLDSGRYGWSPQFHIPVYFTGIVLTLTGHTIFLVARSQNKFFSSVVRIQTDRGHIVCDTGLYRIIRHPGYLGMLVATAGFPFLLGSVWSLVPVLVSIVLLLTRTALEDKTLYEELEGYKDYSLKTRHRIIPGIW